MNIDVVYTWVDGTWPGYADLLQRYASDAHDRNPNRYRDNIGILKYNLRSLERYAPWVRHVFLVTCRPQQPDWLDARAVRLVHHDAFMPAAHLPTFNSFAIVANLHRIPGLSQRFVYVEDDRLFGAPVDRADLFDEEGRPRVFLSNARRSPDSRHDSRLSPWNRAVAYSNQLLNERYGVKPRRTVSHTTPLAVDIESWTAMIACWPEAFARTSASRFRATENVAPEHLYPHFLLEERRGMAVPRFAASRDTAYHPLNNFVPFQHACVARLRWRRPKFVCMNDNFGARPNPRVVALITRALDTWFPEPSRFEHIERVETTEV